MAEESQNTLAPPVAEAPPPAAPAATPPPAESTPAEITSSTPELDRDIEDLWAKAEGKAPTQDPPPAAEPVTATDPPPAESPKTDAPKAETPPAADPAEIERQVRERIAAEERTRQQTEDRLRADQQHRQAAEAYVGPEADYQAVNQALRAALAGDTSALDALDVVLPNGKKVSEVKGDKGLTDSEAANLLTAWDTARKFEDAVGDRKVQRIVDLWNSRVMSVLGDPDVDTAAVTKEADPAAQMQAAIESTRAAVTRRLTEAHTAEIKAKDAEIAKLNERVTSLTNERGNLTSQRQAAGAATVDRPGQPGALRTDLPSPEDLRRMPADEFFKSGLSDRLLRSIPGGQAPRRAG